MQLSDPCNFFNLDDRTQRGDEGPDTYSDELAAANQAWMHQLSLERQEYALNALESCLRFNVPIDVVNILASELGLKDEFEARLRQESFKGDTF